MVFIEHLQREGFERLVHHLSLDLFLQNHRQFVSNVHTFHFHLAKILLQRRLKTLDHLQFAKSILESTSLNCVVAHQV